MFSYTYPAKGTLILTNKDGNANCSATMKSSITASVTVKTNTNDCTAIPEVIVDPGRRITTLWTTTPEIPYYNAILSDLLKKAEAKPTTDTGGYWECSIWDASTYGTATPAMQ